MGWPKLGGTGVKNQYNIRRKEKGSMKAGRKMI